MAIITIDKLKEQLGQKSRSSISDIKDIIERFLNRKDIDLITRIKDTELDKICNMLHHTHQITLVCNKAFLTKVLPKDVISYKPVMCSGEAYVLQNLSLRLSLESKSREELVQVFVSLIKTELELEKKTNDNKEDNKR